MTNRWQIIALVLALPFGIVSAKCLPKSDSTHPCRYVEGDAWCAKNGNGNPYAYSDDCLKRSSIATKQEWERCRDKAESSVNQLDVGVVGVETEIMMKCGAPPPEEPSLVSGSVGMHPYDLVRSKAWKSKFVRIAKDNYSALVDRLVVASETILEGHWIVGEGQAPHSGGIENAAIAINSETGEVYAAIMESGIRFSRFGFSSWQSAPPFLQQWWNRFKN
jgi:hypothetical protein